MTPSARIAAAIELLEVIEAAPERAADRTIAAFFRMRRYAGAKDRGAIADLVWLVLRRRGEFIWRLAGGTGEDLGVSPRLLVFAALMLEQGMAPEEIARLCDGGHYAPHPLASVEAARLGALGSRSDTPAVPDWVRGFYPAWLDASLRARFGADLLPEMQALASRAPVDLRVNLRKAARTEAQAALADAGITTRPTPLSPQGLRLEARRPLDGIACFRQGWVEIQDEGSQLVSQLVDARPGMAVVDVCAGAGGKTLALAAAMGGAGRLIASDADPARLERLGPRAQRAGADFIEILPLAALPAGTADRVLLDVPCSGTGAWRRRPDARWRLRPADLERDLVLQAELLAQGAELVKPGGRLIYATCSLLPEENEAQIARFLKIRPDFRRRDAAALWRDLLAAPAPLAGPDLLLTPRRHGTDGFFAAILERDGHVGTGNEPEPQPPL